MLSVRKVCSWRNDAWLIEHPDGLCIVMAFILCSVFGNRENCPRLHDLLGSIICWLSRGFFVISYAVV